MSTTPYQQRSPKDLFWQAWQAHSKHILTPHYALGSYCADFAHLPTQTIIEMIRLAPDPLRDQLKRSGWQIVALPEREVIANPQNAAYKINNLLTNKIVYLQKKNIGQGSSQQSPQILPKPQISLVKPLVQIYQRPTCPHCGGTTTTHDLPCYLCREKASTEQAKQSIVLWARALMMRDDWIVIDTETTGLTRRDEIIEIAIVNSKGQTVLDTLVKPQRRIPADASAVHGIYNEQVKNAPTFAEIWPTIANHFQQLVLAYNAKFDVRLLDQTLQKYALLLPTEMSHDCIMKRYTTYEKLANPQGPARLKLQYACEDLGIQAGQHRALGDTLAAWWVIKRLSEIN